MDVPVHGRRIFYVSDDCEGRRPHAFCLHVVPPREADLPADWREQGYDNLDSHQAGVTFGERCVVRWLLPDYPIRRIRTGRFVAVSGRGDGEQLLLHRLWEGEPTAAEQAGGPAASMCQRGANQVRSSLGSGRRNRQILPRKNKEDIA